MADWTDLASKMDAVVDDKLGDDIAFSADGGVSWSTIKGFVLPASSTGGIIGMDEPLGARNRVKLPRDLFADGHPGRNVRLRHSRLGTGTFRPAGGEPEEQGRYVLFDVQKVS